MICFRLLGLAFGGWMREGLRGMYCGFEGVLMGIILLIYWI